MPKVWTVNLECRSCYALISIVNETPEWKRPTAEEIEIAEQWVEEHKDDRLALGELPPESLPTYVETVLLGIKRVYIVSDAVNDRWVECPACGGRADPIKATEHIDEESDLL